MSNSSAYEPSEDEEASDSGVESRASTSKTPPHIQDLRLSSDSDEHDDSDVVLKTARGTRKYALRKRLESLTGPSVEAYSSLLEETTKEFMLPTNVNPQISGSEYIGVVLWANWEKDIFFDTLTRKGKNGVREIANAVGTKSELEVQELLELLHQGVERHHLHDPRRRTIGQGEVPAAAEIGQQCCAVLDEYAELLSIREQLLEDNAVKKEHGIIWRIDQKKAASLGRVAAQENGPQDDNDSALPSVHPFAKLFDMDKWIRISERFFMNADDPKEDNWTNVAFEDETPSVRADAFADFYNLTVSLTRRLVQSTLVFAMARLRNWNYSGHHENIAKTVKPRDVKTALDVLNMKHDASDFWAGVPRRCRLKVVDVRHIKGWQPRDLTYDEVEEILSKQASDEAKYSKDEAGAAAPSRHGNIGPGILRDDEMNSDSDSILSSPLISPQESEDEAPANIEDEHAEKLDLNASTLEELHLWKTLNRPAPADLDMPIKSEDEDESKVTEKPTGERKAKQDLVDWRNMTLYRSDWEEYGDATLDLYDGISENRRKRRRVDSGKKRSDVFVPLSDSDADSEMEPGSNLDVEQGDEMDIKPAQRSESEMDIDIGHLNSDGPDTATNTGRDRSMEREAEHLHRILEQGPREDPPGGREPDQNTQITRQRAKSPGGGTEPDENEGEDSEPSASNPNHENTPTNARDHEDENEGDSEPNTRTNEAPRRRSVRNIKTEFTEHQYPAGEESVSDLYTDSGGYSSSE